MVETRIKPYYQQVAEKEAREQQRRAFRRNQVFGLMIVAGAICVVAAAYQSQVDLSRGVVAVVKMH